MANAFLGMSGFGATLKAFPTDRFLAQYPQALKRACIALCPGTFGWNTRTITAFQARGFKRIMVEIHIACGPGRRRGSWPSDFQPNYSISEWNKALENNTPKLMKAIAERVTKILDWLPPCPPPTTRLLLLCPELEDNISDQAYRNFAAVVRQTAPGIKIVRSPCTKGKWGGQDITEYHGKFGGSASSSVLLNTDGMSINLSDDSSYDNCMSVASAAAYAKKYYHDARAIMFWHHDQQGWHGVSNFHMTIPPLERDCIVTDGAIKTFSGIFKDTIK